MEFSAGVLSIQKIHLELWKTLLNGGLFQTLFQIYSNAKSVHSSDLRRIISQFSRIKPYLAGLYCRVMVTAGRGNNTGQRVILSVKSIKYCRDRTLFWSVV